MSRKLCPLRNVHHLQKHTLKLALLARWAHATDCARGRSNHSMMDEPDADGRARSWEVYAAMPGIDSLYSGLSKRTPTGGFFSS